ncbi:portal protein [Rhodovarius lipocyclicus]|uniref:portal protein n=1 Tax=Rhodovarius lipocyclicus TaxID=268410 RepID=UPI00135912BB|nr:portal protein [Rhodovarius lipocyclicus]
MSDDTGGQGDDFEEEGSELEDEALARRAQEFKRKALDHAQKWREEAAEDYAFPAGDQWTREERARLEEDGRPVITFNRIGPMVQAVVGSEVNNRQEIKAIPRSFEDAGAADVATKLITFARQQSQAEDEESHAFTDLVTCGMGWTELRMDYSSEPDGEICVDRFDPAEALWDPAARKKNLADGREFGRVRKWRLDVAMEEWPEKAAELRAAQLLGSEDGAEQASALPRDRYGTTGFTLHDNESRVPMVEILHYQWCEEHHVVLVSDASGRQELEPEEWDKVRKRLRLLGLPEPRSVKQKRRKWYQAVVAGNVVLERGDCPFPDGPTLRCMTGILDRNTGHFYGIVRPMKDPQRWANMFFVQAHHVLATSAKSGLLIEEGAVEDVRELERTYALPGGVSKLNPGGLNRIKEKMAANVPAGLERMMQFAVASIPDVTGINREMLGLADREQAGVLEAQRKQAAQAILAPLFDGLRRYRKGVGEVLLYFIRQYMPRDIQVRVLGEDGKPEWLSAAMLPDAAKYDIIVDEAPTSPNAKQEVWASLAPMLPAIMKLGMPTAVWGEILKYSPIPASAVERIMAALQQQEQQPGRPDPEAQKVQAQIAGEQAKTQASIQATQMKARAEVEAKAMTTQADIEIKRAAAEAKRTDQAMAAWLRAVPYSPLTN